MIEVVLKLIHCTFINYLNYYFLIHINYSRGKLQKLKSSLDAEFYLQRCLIFLNISSTILLNFLHFVLNPIVRKQISKIPGAKIFSASCQSHLNCTLDYLNSYFHIQEYLVKVS